MFYLLCQIKKKNHLSGLLSPVAAWRRDLYYETKMPGSDVVVVSGSDRRELDDDTQLVNLQSRKNQRSKINRRSEFCLFVSGCLLLTERLQIIIIIICLSSIQSSN